MEDRAGTITRRMSAVFDDLEEQFAGICTPEELERKLAELKAAGKRSSRPSILAELFELLDLCGVRYQRDRENRYYETLVREKVLPGLPQAEEQMLRALSRQYMRYPTPEVYMKRIVDRLSAPEDGWQGDPLRLRILKQFIRYGDYLAEAGYRGRGAIQSWVRERLGHAPSLEEVLDCVDDGVFLLLDTASKPQKKPEGTYGLLKLADDLAKGNFRVGGATKRGLYLFAMVYGMTYYSGRGDERLAYETDLERNLFQDYYANNLMRYLSAEYRQRLCEYEQDPSGQGINYKNFAEMVYVYFIASDLEPAEKIRRSAAMIRRLQQTPGGPAPAPVSGPARDTRYFKGRMFGQMLFCEDLLCQTEGEFEHFLRTNYNCATRMAEGEGRREHNLGPLQLEPEQNTAFACYRSLLEELEARTGGLEYCRYGLWFTDVAALQKRLDPGEEGEQTAALLKLLEEADSYLRHALEGTNAGNITRTRLLSAFYYLYNARCESAEEPLEELSFRACFRHFAGQADQVLESAGYQRLDGKNLFDVLVVFSSYARMKL